MLDTTPHGGHPLPPFFHHAGVQRRSWAVADRWTDYLAARHECDIAASRLSHLVTLIASFSTPPATIARRLRSAAVALLQAWGAAVAAKRIYDRAAAALRVGTRWRGCDDEGAFRARVQYSVSLATALAAARFRGEVR